MIGLVAPSKTLYTVYFSRSALYKLIFFTHYCSVFFFFWIKNLSFELIHILDVWFGAKIFRSLLHCMKTLRYIYFLRLFVFFNFKDILDAAIRMFGYFFLMSRRLLVWLNKHIAKLLFDCVNFPYNFFSLHVSCSYENYYTVIML